MANLPDAWGWWGNEGGRRLDVTRMDNGAVLFGITGEHGQEFVTLANFRIKQLRDWLNASAAVEETLTATAESQEGQHG